MKLYWKNVRYLEGAFNGRENSRCVLQMYADGKPNAIVRADFYPGDRNMVKLNHDVEAFALRVTYEQRTGPVYFGGARIHFVPGGKQA